VIPPELAAEDFCYLTTTGRVTGRPHRIEIWFALEGTTAYLLAGGRRADWVHNLVRNPEVTFEVAGRSLPAHARLVDDAAEQQRARTLLYEKYTPRYRGNLERWRDAALPVAVDLADPL
jgi:deazaflavin-dependent oxidoreductase (nitroreductase family)